MISVSRTFSVVSVAISLGPILRTRAVSIRVLGNGTKPDPGKCFTCHPDLSRGECTLALTPRMRAIRELIRRLPSLVLRHPMHSRQQLEPFDKAGHLLKALPGCLVPFQEALRFLDGAGNELELLVRSIPPPSAYPEIRWPSIAFRTLPRFSANGP
jgi:hypothetical protein